MDSRYFKEYSPALGREMEYKVFGTGGRLCFAFPPQNGRFYDFENFGMIATLAPWIDGGRLTVVCPDSIDVETLSDTESAAEVRLALHEKWHHYIVDELYPRTAALIGTTQKAIVTGCSMGAVHAGTFFFRRPDLFDTLVSLSGTFDAGYFFPGCTDARVYENSPVQFLRNMPEEHPYMALYRASDIILCVGQGAWEEDLLEGTRALDAVLQQKNIPAWVDYWGLDVSHDWCWWQKQLPYFFEKLTEEWDRRAARAQTESPATAPANAEAAPTGQGGENAAPVSAAKPTESADARADAKPTPPPKTDESAAPAVASPAAKPEEPAAKANAEAPAPAVERAWARKKRRPRRH